MNGDHDVTTVSVSSVTTGADVAPDQPVRRAPPGIRTQNLRIKSGLWVFCAGSRASRNIR